MNIIALVLMWRKINFFKDFLLNFFYYKKFFGITALLMFNIENIAYQNQSGLYPHLKSLWDS